MKNEKKAESWPERHPYLTTYIALTGIAAIVQIAVLVKGPPVASEPPAPAPAPPRPFPPKKP